jgi:hypothetical protein
MKSAYRVLSPPLPFVGDSNAPVQLEVQQLPNGQLRGVNFKTSCQDPSPHVTRTHAESARHIDPQGPTLEAVLKKNPSYQKPMPALHLRVQPRIPTAVSRGAEDAFIVSGKEGYPIPKDARISDDKIVDCQSLHEGMQEIPRKDLLAFTNSSSPKALLLQISGADNAMQNWPYLTNDAMVKAMSFKAQIIVLNTASADRKEDGGLVSNHRIFFLKDRHHLIIELAKLAHLPVGLGTCTLDITPHKEYLDCGMARVEFSLRSRL